MNNKGNKEAKKKMTGSLRLPVIFDSIPTMRCRLLERMRNGGR